MIVTILIVLPLLFGLAAIFSNGRSVRNAALAVSLAEFCLALYAAYSFVPQAGMQQVLNLPWIPALGIHYHVGVDGIGLLLILLTALLMPFILYSTPDDIPKPGAYYGLMLVMQAALIGVFSALDGFLFYVFWEMALIPIWFLCLLWGRGNTVAVTLKFFIYTLFGSLLMLVALIYLYLQTPQPHSFSLEVLYAVSNLDANVQGWLFWAFFLAFAIKIPIFPFHSWQPDTYVTAPTQGTMLLSGIMLKMGIYGAMRWLIPVLPMGVHNWMPVAVALSVAGAVYASVIALQQNDLKRMLAYSSMAHVGIIGAGLFSLTANGLTGVVFQMLAHGINTVALFYVADIIERRNNTRNLNLLGGIALADPRFSVLVFVCVLGAVAFPLTNGFIGEFYLLYGLFEYNLPMCIAGGLTVILGAAYMLQFFQKTMFGNAISTPHKPVYAGKSELYVLVPLTAIILLTGIYPKPLLNLAAPAIEQLLQLAQF
ncbi:NADH-quinone oxidoreductase subunit M [Sphingobacteriales bacterium UPWRP_1]|nr:NADH-quinone oxidoreductase subunit M [Sphingobacteriales bacterium TSM_CSS]PSJ74742.1 NADH-quinone oxidoreductase subunit M [Sphingobacteriales bacterium UPWRP_1]